MEAGAILWPLIVANHGKGKLTAPGDAERALAAAGHTGLDAVEQACLALQAWCWLRGMPPIDRLVAHPRTQGPVRVAPGVSYDVFHAALGWDVHSERAAFAYPWAKVRPPTSAQLGVAAAAGAAHGAAVAAWRLLDLELEQRDSDAARGRRRPAPDGCASWADAQARHAAAGAALSSLGLAPADLRPPGAAPYPPVPPRVAMYDH